MRTLAEKVVAMIVLCCGLATLACAADRTPIYDESGNGEALLTKAQDQARQENKRVLIQWGGNWCGWCWKLHDLCEQDAGISAVLKERFVVVHIDTGSNKELQDKLAPNCNGYPYLTVVDSERRIYANQATGPLEVNGTAHDPKKVLAFLNMVSPPPVDAQAAFDAALKQAAAEDKAVFMRVGGPNCPWCRKLEGFLARPKVTEALAAAFVHLDIDIENAKGAEALVEQYRKMDGGTPWFAFLDKTGKTIVTSDGPQGNIGCPFAPEEIAYFAEMLTKTMKKGNDTNIAFIRDKLLEDNAAATKAGG